MDEDITANNVKPKFMQRSHIPIRSLVQSEDLAAPHKTVKLSDIAGTKSLFKNPGKGSRRGLNFRQHGKVIKNKTVTKEKLLTDLTGMLPLIEKQEDEIKNFSKETKAERQCVSIKQKMSPKSPAGSFISKIIRLVQELQQLHLDRKKHLESLRENQKVANKKFEQLLKLLQNEENPSRRSFRLTKNSPVVGERVDLRKHPLDGSFSIKLQATPKRMQSFK